MIVSFVINSKRNTNQSIFNIIQNNNNTNNNTNNIKSICIEPNQWAMSNKNNIINNKRSYINNQIDQNCSNNENSDSNIGYQQIINSL